MGISTKGDFGKDSHHPQFPPLPLLSSSYTHNTRHCLCDVLTPQSVRGELFIVVRVLYELDAFDLVIAISYPFGIRSLMRPFSDSHHDALTVGRLSFLLF